MHFLALSLWFFLTAPALAEPCEGPEDCGIAEITLPDFALVDENTRSESAGRTVSRDDLLGEVLLIYWAQAT